jgi:hypothetical protein
MQSMRNFIQEICDMVGPRPPCTIQEQKGAEFIKNKYSEICENTTIEEFSCNPAGYKMSFRLPMILYLLALFFYYNFPIVSLISSIIATVIIVGEMTLSYDIIDFLFPKKTSHNVISKITVESPHKGPPKRLVIIGGHIDSNYEFILMKKLGYKFGIVVTMNFMMSVIMSMFLIIRFIFILSGNEGQLTTFVNIFFCIFIFGSPFALLQLLFIISNLPVMGANDNLSAVAICYELLKHLTKEGSKPKNIEVWIAQYGCEEIGSKGSREFIKKHYAEIKEAIAINIDMVGNKNQLQLATTEMMGLAPLSKELIEHLYNIGKRLNIPIKAAPDMGFTDSLSFARKKIKSTSIVSVPASNKEFFYHTRNDVIENVYFENLENCLNLLKNSLKNWIVYNQIKILKLRFFFK